MSWERADGVVAPELAATWCDLAIGIGEYSITLVRDRRNDAIRQEVRTSAYPLALWVAERWWALTGHVRASAADTDALRWTARFRPSWLSWHNLRGAGDGMPWPDLSVIPEGGMARLVWFKSAGLAGQPVTFLTSGNAFVPIADLRAELTEFVESVLTRLDRSGVHGSALHREWESLADLDDDEQDFVRACSRLGLDPFDLPDTMADQVEELDRTVPAELVSPPSADGGRALLDPSHRAVPRASRAFAAELLAPATGIEQYLKAEPEQGERAFELIADHFGAKPHSDRAPVPNHILADRR